jgi:tetratricopeptide (TPR) repeat protein
VSTRGCLDPTELDRLARGGVPAAEWVRYESHLDTCPDCARLLAELARIYGAAWSQRAERTPAIAGSSGGVAGVSANPSQPPKTAFHVFPSFPPASPTPLTPQAVIQGSVPYAQTLPSTPPPAYGTAPPPRPAPPQPPHEAGPVLGRYRLGARLGEGGMGVVFAAYDPELDRRVAVKLLHPDPFGDPERQRARLIREAQAMAKLSHPNVVAIYDVGRVGEQLFVACELVEGETLGAWLRATPAAIGARAPRRPQREVLALFVHAGRGLEAAHAVGLVHRDFKPENVLVGTDGRPRVTDFGLARTVDEWGPAAGGGAGRAGAAATAATVPLSSAHTLAGAFAGTPAYMAPEQFRGEPADARTDQFSFCVALYEALYGRPPFDGETLPDRMRSVLEGRPRPPPSESPAWLRVALLRGLAPRREDRWPSMGALLAELGRGADEGANSGRSTRLAITAAVALAAIGGAGAIAALVFVLTSSTEHAAAGKGDGAAGARAASAAGDEVDPACVVTGLDARWNDARRAAVTSAADGADRKVGPPLAKHARAALDAYAERFATARRGACAPGPAVLTDAQSPRAQCLDDRRRRFDALVSTLEKGTTYAFEAAPAAIDALAPPESCGDAAWLASNAAPAPKPELRARVGLLRDDVAKIQASVDVGALEPVRELSGRVVDDALKLGDPSLLAEARYAAGRVQRARGEPTLAEPLLTDALASAREAKRDELARAIALELAEVIGVELASPVEAERWLKTAIELRPAGDDAAALQVALTEGRLRMGAADYALAKEALTKAVSLANQLDERSAASALARTLLAEAYLGLEEPDHAASRAEQAIELLESLGGDHDMRLADPLIALGRARSLVGRHDDAIATLLRARKLREGESMRFADDRLFFAQEALAEAYGAAGKLAEAEKELRHASANMEVHASMDGRRVWKAVGAGALLERQGKPRDAAVTIAEGLAIAEKEWGVDDPRLVDPLCALARAQSLAGDHAAARKTHERALALADAAFGMVSTKRGLVAMEMGEASERAKDDKRALADYDDAYLGLSGLGAGHPRVDANVVRRAALCERLGDRKRALELMGAALSTRERLRGADDPSVAALRSDLEALKKR